MSSTQLTTHHTVRARAGARRAVRTPHDSDALWTPGERIVPAVAIALGVLLVLVAWLGASNTTQWDTQLRWTALAMVGVVVVCIGVGVWLSTGFARVRADARAVRFALTARLAPTTGENIRRGGDRVTVTGMTHHHAPDCLLVAGKTTMSADEGALAPCGVCG